MGRSGQANCQAAQLILNNRMSKSLRRYGRSGRSDWLQHQGGGGGSRRQRRYRRPHLGTKEELFAAELRGGTWWYVVTRRQRHVTPLALGLWALKSGDSAD